MSRTLWQYLIVEITEQFEALNVLSKKREIFPLGNFLTAKILMQWLKKIIPA